MNTPDQMNAPASTPTISVAIGADEHVAAARARYVGSYAGRVLLNRYLCVAVVALALVALALVADHLHAHSLSQHLRPLIVRINDVGRAEAVRYDPTAPYAPREPELRYFLHQFVSMHFARMRATVRRDYANSLLFLDAPLAQATVAAQRETQAIEKFLGSADPDVDIDVRNVTLQEIRKAPYRASVDYERVYTQPNTRRELKRERYVGTFEFVIADHVPNALVPINPLGLLVTYFREDQAF